MILCGRNGSLKAAAQEFSAEQIAQLASRDAMHRLAQLQAQLEALQRENEDFRQRRASSAPHRGTPAELGALRQELAALRSENKTLKEQHTANAASPQVDPVLRSQLAALRRENAALRSQRLIAHRLDSAGKCTVCNGNFPHSSGKAVHEGPDSHQNASAAAEEVSRLQLRLQEANELAKRHESEAQQLAEEVGCCATCTQNSGSECICHHLMRWYEVRRRRGVLQMAQLQEKLQIAHDAVLGNPQPSMGSRHTEGRLALESLQSQNDRLRAQYSATLQARRSPLLCMMAMKPTCCMKAGLKFSSIPHMSPGIAQQ